MTSERNIQEKMRLLKCAVMIPTYNNAGTICHVIEGVKAYCRDIIVIDDGSTDATPQLLDGVEGIIRTGYTPNRGKGRAIRCGLKCAAQHGFDYVISIDADGQHYPDDIPSFVEELERSPESLIIGARSLTAENMPSKNTFANKFSNFWYHFETGQRLEDTQSGFRLYPVRALSKMHFFTSRYEFEVEVIVRAAWRGIEVKNIPIKVYYPPEGERVTHFRPGVDFTRISILNTCLVTYALLIYYPFRFLKWLRWENVKGFIDRHIIHSKESNHLMALSVAWGVLWGMMPVWGWQGIVAVATGCFMKLNKVVTFAATNISVPPMIPLILYGGYALGGVILGLPITISFRDITWESLAGSLVQYGVGSVVLAVAAALIVYPLCRLLFRIFKRNMKES